MSPSGADGRAVWILLALLALAGLALGVGLLVQGDGIAGHPGLSRLAGKSLGLVGGDRSVLRLADDRGELVVETVEGFVVSVSWNGEPLDDGAVDRDGDLLVVHPGRGGTIDVPLTMDADLRQQVLQPRRRLGLRLEPAARDAGPDGSVRVAWVATSGPAAGAGLRAGDVLTGVDGAPARDPAAWHAALAAALTARLTGGELTLDVTRGDETLLAVLTLAPLAPADVLPPGDPLAAYVAWAGGQRRRRLEIEFPHTVIDACLQAELERIIRAEVRELDELAPDDRDRLVVALVEALDGLDGLDRTTTARHNAYATAVDATVSLDAGQVWTRLIGATRDVLARCDPPLDEAESDRVAEAVARIADASGHVELVLGG